MRKIALLLAAAALAVPALAVGPKFSTSGGVGSSASTFQDGEPTGGTYTINGTTGRVSAPIINLRPGSAPTTPQNGDCWTTIAGLFCRINGVNIGPFQSSEGAGTVTQVGLVPPSIFTAGAPVTTTGNLSFSLNSQTGNQVFAGPNGSSGTPGFRALVGADIPAVDVGASGNGGVTGTLAIANGGTGSTTAASARNALGLGTLATQNAATVAITGGSISGITDLAVADGGTGASSASAARTNLGLGTAATQNTGTSGASVPLLNAANTWASAQALSAGGTYAGTFRSQQYAGPYTSQVNAYGGRFLVTTAATDNAVVGAVVQDGTNGNSFPTGATGYALVVDSGNQGFGLFGQADLGTSGGSAVNGTAVGAEVNCYNFSGAPSATLPPDLSFGTSQKNCLAFQVVAKGTYNSSIGINMAGAGGDKKFETGLYFHPENSATNAILIDATSTNSASNGIVIKGTPTSFPLTVQTKGAMQAGYPVLNVLDTNGTSVGAIKQNADFYGRALVSAAIYTPTVSTCTGAGTGGTCVLATGSSDGMGTITVTGGTGAPTAGGTIGLTFSSAIGINGSSCQIQHATNFLSNTSMTITGQTATGVTFTYLNGGGTGTALTNGTAYQINYICAGR